jgi:hypothetical protein
MVGITEHERRATGLLHQRLVLTPAGRRWERLFRAHEAELTGLLVVHPDVRGHVADALGRLAECSKLDGAAPVDTATLTSAYRVLDDLQRLGGFELRQLAACLRDELERAHGGALAEVLSAR